jgi:hypothetical protein
LAENVIERLRERGELPVALHGGVLESSPIVIEAFRERLKRGFPGATLRTEAIDGARGALKRARRNSGRG